MILMIHTLTTLQLRFWGWRDSSTRLLLPPMASQGASAQLWFLRMYFPMWHCETPPKQVGCWVHVFVFADVENPSVQKQLWFYECFCSACFFLEALLEAPGCLSPEFHSSKLFCWGDGSEVWLMTSQPTPPELVSPKNERLWLKSLKPFSRGNTY